MNWFATVMHRRVSRGTLGSVMRLYAQSPIIRSCDGSTGRHEALPTIDMSKRHARQIIRRIDSATTAGEDAAHAPGKSG
jgi:hypothetical protein